MKTTLERWSIDSVACDFGTCTTKITLSFISHKLQFNIKKQTSKLWSYFFINLKNTGFKRAEVTFSFFKNIFFWKFYFTLLWWTHIKKCMIDSDNTMIVKRNVSKDVYLKSKSNFCLLNYNCTFLVFLLSACFFKIQKRLFARKRMDEKLLDELSKMEKICAMPSEQASKLGNMCSRGGLSHSRPS